MTTSHQSCPASSVPLWWLTKDGDKSCLALYRRHYSAAKAYADGRERYQFVGPGEHIVLRTAAADALFVWRNYIDDTIPKQEGIECAVFRNEGPWLASELIRQADAIADIAWPSERHYTKVNPAAVRSANPGYCFLRAGWRRCGYTKARLLILERQFPHAGGDGCSASSRATSKRGGERAVSDEQPMNLERLQAFAKEIIRFAWDGSVDGGDVQEAAIRHGLIIGASYDPARHGQVDAEPGDQIYEFADWMK